jgi:tetrahydromethanopterin S-methyltransferase subunit C
MEALDFFIVNTCKLSIAVGMNALAGVAASLVLNYVENRSSMTLLYFVAGTLITKRFRVCLGVCFQMDQFLLS